MTSSALIFSDFFYIEYGFSLVFLNILFYLLSLLLVFSLLFLFDLSKIKTLSDLKNLNNLPFVGFSFFLSLLSLAGIPPLSGFSVKFLTFMFLFLSNNYLVVFFFAFINFFFLFFYIQNIRALVSTNTSNFFFSTKVNNKLVYNDKIVFIIVLLNLFNFFGIFFLEDILLFVNYIFSFSYV